MVLDQVGPLQLVADKGRILVVFWTHQPFESVSSEEDYANAIEVQEMSPQLGAKKRSPQSWRMQGQESCSSSVDRAEQHPR